MQISHELTDERIERVTVAVLRDALLKWCGAEYTMDDIRGWKKPELIMAVKSCRDADREQHKRNEDAANEERKLQVSHEAADVGLTERLTAIRDALLKAKGELQHMLVGAHDDIASTESVLVMDRLKWKAEELCFATYGLRAIEPLVQRFIRLVDHRDMTVAELIAYAQEANSIAVREALRSSSYEHRSTSEFSSVMGRQEHKVEQAFARWSGFFRGCVEAIHQDEFNTRVWSVASLVRA